MNKEGSAHVYDVLFCIDKRNQQLKFEIWDVNKKFETDTKVMGSNLIISILHFIDNNVSNLDTSYFRVKTLLW